MNPGHNILDFLCTSVLSGHTQKFPSKCHPVSTLKYSVLINTLPNMKTPELSRTSCVGHLLLLLAQNSLVDVIWRHNVTSQDVILWRHMSHHIPCHLDWTRHLSIVVYCYAMKFYLVTLTFDLRPWSSIPAQQRSRSTLIPMKTPERSRTSRVSQIVQSFCPKVLSCCYGLRDTHKSIM